MNPPTALDVMEMTAHTLADTSLDVVLAHAELQVRTDRKYIVPARSFEEFIASVAEEVAVLQIDSRRVFHYDSVYFDTPDLRCYRHHATGRRRRFKVRTRTYLDSGTSMLEVKTEGRREETVKDRLPYHYANRHRLIAAAFEFVSARVPDTFDPSTLHAVLETTYRRMTLLNTASGTRVTCDAQLACSGNGRLVHGLDRHVLVETKGTGAATEADRALWRLGIRPVSLSKYCIGTALIHPRLPANKWNRTLRDYFDWSPTWAERVRE